MTSSLKTWYLEGRCRWDSISEEVVEIGQETGRQERAVYCRWRWGYNQECSRGYWDIQGDREKHIGCQEGGGEQMRVRVVAYQAPDLPLWPLGGAPAITPTEFTLLGRRKRDYCLQ